MTARIPISVVIPVKDEEANLSSCLEKLGRFDEIVVVDSGSTDRTRAIAEEHSARVLDFVWDGQFPKKRNWVLLNHTLRNEWVLFLDADEFVTDEFCDEASQAVSDPDIAGYWLNYTNYFLGKPLRHGEIQRKLALFRVGRGLYEKIEEDSWSTLDMEVHEHPQIDGPIGEITARIDHRDDRGIAKFVQRHKDYALWEALRAARLREADDETWAKLTSRQQRKYRSIDKWWFAWTYFGWSFFWRRGFLDGGAGFSHAFYKAWYFWTIRLLMIEAREKGHRQRTKRDYAEG